MPEAKEIITYGGSLKTVGTSAQRPTGKVPRGFMFYDTELQRPLWWSGSGWLTAAGEAPPLPAL